MDALVQSQSSPIGELDLGLADSTRENNKRISVSFYVDELTLDLTVDLLNDINEIHKENPAVGRPFRNLDGTIYGL